MVKLNLLLSFGAGFLAFFSPCILPIIPGYFSYLTGLDSKALLSEQNAVQTRGLVMRHSLFFVLGFMCFFILLGAAASSLGQLMADQQFLIKKIGAVVVFGFALYMLGIIKLDLLEKASGSFKYKKGSISYLGSFLVGLTFSAGWSACVGPVLASILFMASGAETFWLGIGYLLSFSLGLAIPFLLAAFFLAQLLKSLQKFTRYMFWIKMASGVVLLIASIYLWL
ncbi:MAG: cytochrome c biogenesis protein CcdA [Candidatus Margulisiibacteriota bacterium]|jgi:cytochrome c-type biogenesis protein